MLNGLDLFSGIGGMSLALKEWVYTFAFCEIDPYCQAVLLQRMLAGHFEMAGLWDDIRTMDGKDIGTNCDIIFGGFPCQDISIAGHGKGLGGERSGLFFEIIRLAKEIKPKFIFLENVPAITTRGGIEVVNKITSLGYDCRWCIISAEGLMAPQKRERWFLLAHSNSEPSWKTNKKSITESQKKETWIRPCRQNWRDGFGSYWKKNKRPVLGMDDGFPFELDRSRSLANAVVPQQARKAFKVLMGLK
jgi:DNA (cytosine-5)-methyltransferase 1